jgi:hypothetical protein
MSAIAAVNDFVIKFANINGSGSASANELFAKSILRMGVPIASRNIFPSNIQGLPTWFEVRVSEAGHMGRRGGVDMMVAMNPQTWDRDVAEIEPGGSLAHPTFSQVSEMSFRIESNGFSALRVRLFTNGTDPTGKSLNLLFGQMSNETIFGVEKQADQMDNQNRVAAPRNVPVRIAMKDRFVEVSINGVPVRQIAVTPQMKSYQEEIFGPVLQIVRAPDFETALRLPSDHQYGNGVAIFTRNGHAAREFAARARSAPARGRPFHACARPRAHNI